MQLPVAVLLAEGVEDDGNRSAPKEQSAQPSCSVFDVALRVVRKALVHFAALD